MFVVYVKYLQSIQNDVFDIFWHACKMLIFDAAKDCNIFVDLKII